MHRQKNIKYNDRLLCKQYKTFRYLQNRELFTEYYLNPEYPVELVHFPWHIRISWKTCIPSLAIRTLSYTAASSQIKHVASSKFSNCYILTKALQYSVAQIVSTCLLSTLWRRAAQLDKKFKPLVGHILTFITMLTWSHASFP